MKTINLVSDFFASKKESEWNLLQQDQQEQFENEFNKWFEEKMKDFEFASRFLMCHLGNSEKYHPHFTAIVTNTRAEVMQGQESTVYTEDYVSD